MAFTLGLFSLLLALLAFITVVTEDEIGKSARADWVALVAFLSPSALFGGLALWSGRRPVPLGVRVEAWIGILGFAAAVAAPLLARLLLANARPDHGVSLSGPGARASAHRWVDTIGRGPPGATWEPSSARSADEGGRR